MSKIYEPEEDSYLMSDVLKKEIKILIKSNRNLSLLEIGCGSGINLQEAAKSGIKKENILGTDINANAVKECRKLGFNCIKSDLFQNVNGKFSAIVFNPPYLPEDKKEPLDSRRETTGGKKGNEIIIKFLKRAGKHLAEDGRILLIASSLSKDIDFNELGYKARVISTKKLFFEKISVWECLKI